MASVGTAAKAVKVVKAANVKAAKAKMDPERMQANALRASELMKLLGHPQRLMILCELNQGECSVGELSERIGINQSPLSQHLARMRYAGVVECRREAQTVYYSLTGKEVVAVIHLLYQLYCEEPEQLARVARRRQRGLASA